MSNMEKWSKTALFDEWWHLVSSDWSSAIKDKILLSKHYDLPVEGFGDTPGIRFDPMKPNESEEYFLNYKLLEEVLTRISIFPFENLGRYIGGHRDSRAQVQWSLMVMYNIGFSAALEAVKRMEQEKIK